MKNRRSSLPRAPLTNEELERITADDLVKLRLTDDEEYRLRQINMLRERERVERSARLRIEEQPILADLRTVFLDVNSVWDLVNTSLPYPEAVPILLKHLSLPYSDRTRAGIARALAVPEPEVRKARSFLVEEYRKAPMGKGIIAPGDIQEFSLGAKSGLALAVAAATTEADIDDLIALARDRSLGSSRLLLLSRLKRSKSQHAKQALEDLATDPDLEKEIASWRKRRKS